MNEDDTRAALARAHAEWMAAGGDERDPESVAGLLRTEFDADPIRTDAPGGVAFRFSSDATLFAWKTPGHFRFTVDHRGTRRGVPDILSALCALAAAGVPMRAEDEADDYTGGVWPLRPAEPAEDEVSAVLAAATESATARDARDDEVRALRERVAELTGRCDAAEAARRDAECELDLAAGEWRALAESRDRLAAVVTAEDAARVLHREDCPECDRLRIAVTDARAALLPGDLDGGETR